MWTAQDEQRYQSLGSTLGLISAPTPPAPQGLLGYVGQQAANILPMAAEHIIQPMQTLLGGGSGNDQLQYSTIPKFFDTAPPQGIGQHIAAGAAEFASYLPAIIAPEAAGAEALGALGVGARAAKIGGSALGFAFPSAPQGVESAAIQGTAGAVQTAAQDWGWRGKIAAGLLTGAAGYYEGQKQSPQTGIVMGTVNALGPTVIDPILGKILGHSPNDIGGGRPIEGQPATPAQSTFDMMNPAQRQANIQAITNPQDYGQNGLPVGAQGQFRNPSTPDAILGAQPPASGTNWTRQVGLPIGAEEAASSYGNGTNPYDIFAGLQKVPADVQLSPAEQEAARQLMFNRASSPETHFMEVPPGSQEPLSVGELELQRQHAFNRAGIPETQFSESQSQSQFPSEDTGPQHATTQEGPHVISTAIKRNGKIFTGDQPFEAHESIGVQRGLTSGELSDSIPEKERGFIVQNKDSSQSFASRKRAAQMAVKSGQVPEGTTILKSENLRPPATPRESSGPHDIKPGDAIVHWSADGMPLDVKVNGVNGDTVSYSEHNFVTGDSNDKVATVQEFNELQKHPSERVAAPPNPQQPVGPASGLAASSQKVRVQGRHGWEEADVVSREADGTLHAIVKDSIFGDRQVLVLEKDTLPVQEIAPLQIEGGGVPFKDVPSIKLSGKEGAKGAAQIGESEADLLGSMHEGAGPSSVKKTLPGAAKEVLSLSEGLAKLPKEAATVIGQIVARLQEASGQSLDISLAQKMVGAKGGAYLMSGKIALNLQWINGVVHNWAKMSEDAQANAVMRVAALLGHEITHIAQQFGERTNLQIDGVPLIQAVMKHVDTLSEGQRMYIAEQLKNAKGELSGGVSKYLAGDLNAVYGWYKRLRPNLTREEAKSLAAGEMMAEIGSTELSKHMKVDGLPSALRQAIDKFKQAIMGVVNWFRDNNQVEGSKALASLQSISSKMYDHFAQADKTELSAAFPASKEWSIPKVTAPVIPSPSFSVQVQTPFLKTELARLGLRFAVGAATGGIVAPRILGNQITVSEGIILGGIAGIFGPAVAKKLLSQNFIEEVTKVLQASKGNPLKVWAEIMGGKSLRDFGLEGRFGWTGESSSMSKIVRFGEKELNINLDPKQRALQEEGKGFGTEVNAIVNDALDKVRWYKPSPELYNAVEKYFEGTLSKDDFQKLLTTPELQNYGNFITTIREGTTTLTQAYAAGMPKSAFREHLINTQESYIGRFYSAYKEGKFNEDAFDKAKQDFTKSFPEYSGATADTILREYQREIIANRGLFGERSSGLKIDTSTQFRRLATEEEIEAQQVVVGGLEHDPFGTEYKKQKDKLDWMQSHKITDGWREWLGEYKNPVQRMLFTFQKVHPSAVSAKIFDLLDNSHSSSGLKFTYTSKELEQTRGLLEHAQSKESPNSAEFARLQNQLKELSGYGPLPAGSKYGKLAEKWVDRFVRDEISTYDTPFKWMNQPVIRGVQRFNNLIKISRTALNPLTVLRDYMQMPLFALISKTKAGDIASAFKEIHYTKGEDYRLMLRKHIIGADFVTSELLKGPGSVVSGFMDSDIATKAAGLAMNKIFKLHQQPDTLLRAGSFLSARRRFAQQALEDGKFATLQEAIQHSSTIDKAAAFTDRYTMNYGAVPRIVKIGRQLPFVNLFISYTSEITRILKNLTMDAINPTADSAGRMHALTTLGAMAAIPALMVKYAESQLSEKDQQDWDKFKTLSPAELRTRFRIPTSRDTDGRFHYFDITNLIPADSLTEMVRAIGNNDWKGAAAVNPIANLQNTPLLNIVTEQIAGQDIGTGQKIMGYGRVREILKETIPPWIPPGYEGSRLVKSFEQNDQGEYGLTNIKSGVQYKPSDVILNYLTSMKFGNAQLATVQRQAIGEAQSDISVQQGLLRDTLLTNVPQSEKDHAQANYLKAVQEIMLELHSRMGQPTD